MEKKEYNLKKDIEELNWVIEDYLARFRAMYQPVPCQAWALELLYKEIQKRKGQGSQFHLPYATMYRVYQKFWQKSVAAGEPVVMSNVFWRNVLAYLEEAREQLDKYFKEEENKPQKEGEWIKQDIHVRIEKSIEKIAPLVEQFRERNEEVPSVAEGLEYLYNGLQQWLGEDIDEYLSYEEMYEKFVNYWTQAVAAKAVLDEKEYLWNYAAQFLDSAHACLVNYLEEEKKVAKRGEDTLESYGTGRKSRLRKAIERKHFYVDKYLRMLEECNIPLDEDSWSIKCLFEYSQEALGTNVYAKAGMAVGGVKAMYNEYRKFWTKSVAHKVPMKWDDNFWQRIDRLLDTIYEHLFDTFAGNDN